MYFGQESDSSGDCEVHCDNCLQRRDSSVRFIDFYDPFVRMLTILSEYDASELHLTARKLEKILKGSKRTSCRFKDKHI